MSGIKKGFIRLILATTLLSVGSVYAAQATVGSFTPKQKKEIGEVVKQYLLENPSLLVEVSQKLRAQQIETAQKQALKAIGENVSELVSTTSPMLGNPQGSVILVQFLDYQCGHCKAMQPILDKLISENPQLKVVSKNLAILGPNSEVAAKASIAANMQGKFQALHALLEQSKEPLTQEKILALAKEAGLDVPKLEQDMKSETVSKEMASSHQLAQKIGLGGTPAFIVLSHIGTANTKVYFAAGAVPQETLQGYINQSKS
jgi:protein-disulfide isomerase